MNRPRAVHVTCFLKTFSKVKEPHTVSQSPYFQHRGSVEEFVERAESAVDLPDERRHLPAPPESRRCRLSRRLLTPGRRGGNFRRSKLRRHHPVSFGAGRVEAAPLRRRLRWKRRGRRRRRRRRKRHFAAEGMLRRPGLPSLRASASGMHRRRLRRLPPFILSRGSGFPS